jgi:hypothetical protein
MNYLKMSFSGKYFSLREKHAKGFVGVRSNKILFDKK